MNNKASTKVRRRWTKEVHKGIKGTANTRVKNGTWRTNPKGHPANVSMEDRHGAKHPLLKLYQDLQAGLAR